MSPLRSSIGFLCRFALGAVFLYAGILKILRPGEFADSIAAYAVVPRAAVVPLALGLPFFETFLGLGLALNIRLRAAGSAAFLLLGLFIAALAQAKFRGLVIDCGCFGGRAPRLLEAVPPLLRDLLLLATAAYVGVTAGAGSSSWPRRAPSRSRRR